MSENRLREGIRDYIEQTKENGKYIKGRVAKIGYYGTCVLFFPFAFSAGLLEMIVEDIKKSRGRKC